jgi:DNA-binding transcriptional ArsR family regulator
MTASEAGILALSDRNRLFLLRLLLDKPRTVGDLTQVSGLGQSLVSHHLAVLARHGWVAGERQGRRRLYRVTAVGSPLTSLARWIRRHVAVPAEWQVGDGTSTAPRNESRGRDDLEDFLL